MTHEISYVFTDDYTTVADVIHGLSEIGYKYAYKVLQMADGTVHRFCCLGDDERWLELPDMDAALNWICRDIYRLKDAYENCIVRKEPGHAE